MSFLPAGKAAAGSAEAALDENLKCAFCFEVCERPVTVSLEPAALLHSRMLLRVPDARARALQAPCQHNFCLSCFNKWVREGKKTCVKCRKELPTSMRNNPRINSLLVRLIRMVRPFFLGPRPTAPRGQLAPASY